VDYALLCKRLDVFVFGGVVVNGVSSLQGDFRVKVVVGDGMPRQPVEPVDVNSTALLQSQHYRKVAASGEVDYVLGDVFCEVRVKGVQGSLGVLVLVLQVSEESRFRLQLLEPQLVAFVPGDVLGVD